MIQASIINDSINPSGNRLTTFVITYPRWILAEINTHRVLSRNTASSRAIPSSKTIEQVTNNPAMPVRWGLNGRGMQDHGYYTEQDDISACNEEWRTYALEAASNAHRLSNKFGIHKQIANRLIEPFMWTTTLISGTEWENFFALRVHKDAQPEFQRLAYLMLKEYVNKTPQKLDWGEWHIPFGDRMPEDISDEDKVKVATARAARLSYMTFDGEIDINKDIRLHDQLRDSGHFSPFEHSAYADKIGSGNFRGWKQYRHTLPNESKKCDLKQLLRDYECEI